MCKQEIKIEAYFGRKVAIDASMSMYQFLIAMQRPDGSNMLTNDAGEVTSHINGLMMRTTKMLEVGIKPVYVFDGKPPDLKKGTLDDRKEKRDEADAALAKAKEEGDAEAVEKFAKRTVRVSKEMTEDAKTLLRLMGVPVIEAATEAEAQCAALAKAGIVHAAVSEDMDTLTFGAPVMLRNVFVPESRKLPILEITLSKVLEGLNMDMKQFIDLCILMGCDYCGTIKGCGPKTAQVIFREHARNLFGDTAIRTWLDLPGQRIHVISLLQEWIAKHKTIDGVLKAIDTSKHPPPEPFNHEEIHAFFHEPEITPVPQLQEQVNNHTLCMVSRRFGFFLPQAIEQPPHALTKKTCVAQGQFVWKTPDFDGMRKFLVEDKQFSADRIENVIKRLQKTQVRERETERETEREGETERQR